MARPLRQEEPGATYHVTRHAGAGATIVHDDQDRALNGRYAQSFNRRHGRRGHLFRERYRPTRVRSDAHLLLTIRYIARNPLEPRLAHHPCDYAWSSYAGVVGTAPCWPFVSRAAVLEHVGGDGAATALLREFVEGHPPPARA